MLRFRECLGPGGRRDAAHDGGPVLITLVYTGLLGWGLGVGLVLVWQAFHRPDRLLNPLFRNRHATSLFVLHLVVCAADLFVIGPLALRYKSPLWYWGGRIALLSCSLPLGAYLNRNPESFGKLIGYWVVLRNVVEISLHVAVAAAPRDWFHYYLLLWWLVGYRLLDVGPRRLLQTLYNTPDKHARRPWAPALNWAVITLIYVLAFLAVYHRRILYAVPPAAEVPEHVARPLEVALVVGINLVVALMSWGLTKRYTESLVSEAGRTPSAELGPSLHPPGRRA